MTYDLHTMSFFFQAPTIWTVLQAWASNTNPGTPSERQRFLRTHMTETDNILEILLRLVRGERSSYLQNSTITSNKQTLFALPMSNGKAPQNFPATKGEFEHLTSESHYDGQRLI